MPRLASLTSQSLLRISVASIELGYNTLTLDALSYSEGSYVNATLSTTGVPDGTTVNWSLSGVSVGDLETGPIQEPAPGGGFTSVAVEGLTGTFTVQNNTATAKWKLRQDGLTEGTDTFTITLAAADSRGETTNSISASADILDTSNNPNVTGWLDDNDDFVTVRSIISPLAMQVNGVFAVNPTTPFDIVGRTTGAITTVTNITANTGTYLEVDDSGNATAFSIGEALNIAVTYEYDIELTGGPQYSEGTTVSGTVYTTDSGVPQLYWTIENPGAGDFSATQGQLFPSNLVGQRNGDGKTWYSAGFTFDILADGVSEGFENYTISVRLQSASGTVKDTAAFQILISG